jgi:hypothetical protein
MAMPRIHSHLSCCKSWLFLPSPDHIILLAVASSSTKDGSGLATTRLCNIVSFLLCMTAPWAGILDFLVTHSRIKKLFAWRGMKADIKSFVSSCSVCAQAKPERICYPGLLSPLPVPTEAWQVISMDFIDGHLRSGNADCIMVIVDKFSKFAHFVPLLHPYSAPKVAQAFLNSVFRLHGMPTHIISDRNLVFTSTFWKELFKLANTTLCMSSAYHPQSDGQTERVNQCLEIYLRCFIHSCPR